MVDRIQTDRRVLRLYLTPGRRGVARRGPAFAGANVEPVALTLTQPSLDDVFLAVTGQRFEAAPTEQVA